MTFIEKRHKKVIKRFARLCFSIKLRYVVKYSCFINLEMKTVSKTA